MSSRADALALAELRLGLLERLDARRKAAPGQLDLFGGGGPGTGEPCGRGHISRDKTCRIGQAAAPKAAKAEPAAPADQLDLSRPEARLRFTEQLRRNSIAGPQASLDGGDVGEILAQLTEAPGRRGENARRLAAFVDQFQPALFIGGDDDQELGKKPGPGGPLAALRPRLGHLLTDDALKLAQHMALVHGTTAVRRGIEAARFFQNRVDNGPQTANSMKNPKEAHEFHANRKDLADALGGLSTLCQTPQFTEGSTRRGWGQIMVWDEGRPSSPGAGDNRTETYNPRRELDHDAMLRNSRRGLRAAKAAGMMFDSIEGNFGTGTRSKPARRNEEIARVMIHELGHQIQHRAAVPAGQQIPGVNVDYPIPTELQDGLQHAWRSKQVALKEPRFLVSRYAALNTKELFAETFVAYITAPDDLEVFNPALYQWVDKTTKQAMQNLGPGGAR